jgi:hypothetical protein
MFNEVLARKPRRTANLFLWAPLVALGLALGQIWPTLTAAILYGVLGRNMRDARRWLLPALAVAYSQAIWTAVSSIPQLLGGNPASFIPVAVSLVLGGLTFWLQASKGGRIAASVLIAAQALWIGLSALGVAVMLQRGLPTALYAGAASVALPVADVVLLGMMLAARPNYASREVTDVFS